MSTCRANTTAKPPPSSLEQRQGQRRKGQFYSSCLLAVPVILFPFILVVLPFSWTVAAQSRTEQVVTPPAESTTTTTTTTTTATTWKWIPEEEHPCNVPRLTLEELLEKFGPSGLPNLHPTPVVIRPGTARNQEFRSKVATPAAMLSQFEPNFEVTLTSSNSFSQHRNVVTLQEYLYETVKAVETKPDQLSNETWYLFGETYSDEWKRLLQNYQAPPCYSCQYRDSFALALGVGNRGSGVQWHTHGPGFSEAIVGRKHWVLYPNSGATTTSHTDAGTTSSRRHRRRSDEFRPTFHKDYASRHWMEYHYPTAQPKPWECTLEPGDLIYFPAHWWHATINLDPYTVFVSTFTTEHVPVQPPPPQKQPQQNQQDKEHDPSDSNEDDELVDVCLMEPVE